MIEGRILCYSIQLLKMNQESYTYTINKPTKVFYISAILVFIFFYGALYHLGLLINIADISLGWMITNFGWFYMFITVCKHNLQ